MINNFKGKVFYILCDPNLLLKDPWSSIKKKDWASQYEQQNIEIKRKDIRYICQARNINKLNKLVQKKTRI